MPEKKSIFKEFWVQILLIVITAVVSIGFTTVIGSSEKKWDQVAKDHDILIVVEDNTNDNTEQINAFAAQMGKLDGLVKQLEWTSKSLQDSVDKLE